MDAAVLFGTIGLLLAIVLVFLPDHGLIARMRKQGERSRKVLLEDALKQIYDCEHKGTTCTVKHIAGAIGGTQNDAAKIITVLQGKNLATVRREYVYLTDEGREYALRIIRSHRLWERYLADETAVKETEWHTLAERKEHQLTRRQVNQLAAQLGHPTYDPHGDPIPTEFGNSPHIAGKPLSEFAEGERGEILHVEDEPEATYAELVRYGLKPGLIIKVVEKSDEHIVIGVNELQITLTPMMAANLTVEPFRELRTPEDTDHKTLSDLNLGESGIVKQLSPECRGMQRRRLMDLGLLPGTPVTAEMKSPAGEPTAYSIRGATIALRSDQANLVYLADDTAEHGHK